MTYKFQIVLFIFGLIISTGRAHSQSLQCELLASQAVHLEQSDVKLLHTVGQPVAGLFSGSGLQLSVGVHQALDMSSLSVEDVHFTTVSFYPNPTNKSFFVHSQPNKEYLQLRIFNTKGSVVLEQTVFDGEEINVEHLIPGVYLLQLFSSHSQRQNTYKLIKK